MVAELTPLLDPVTGGGLPTAPFVSARIGAGGRKLPQACGHRGFKAEWPENSMEGFRAAVVVGAHGLETDLHLTRDGVVVLSHDPSLKRCFGVDKKVADCDWEYISTLKTLRKPEQGMARLDELLVYLSQPELQNIWVLLDVKMDDDAEELLTRTAEVIASVPSPTPWPKRIMLGGWTEHYIARFREILPAFPVTCISLSPLYARRFLKVPHVNFNILQPLLVGPFGHLFIKAARRADRKILVWTVNKEHWMEWSIRKEMDVVITDDPRLFLDVCRQWETAAEPPKRPLGTRVKATVWAMVSQVIVLVLTSLLYFKYANRGAKKTKKGEQ